MRNHAGIGARLRGDVDGAAGTASELRRVVVRFEFNIFDIVDAGLDRVRISEGLNVENTVDNEQIAAVALPVKEGIIEGPMAVV